MASTLISDSKLMFYPTQDKETYKMLPLLGALRLRDFGYYSYGGSNIKMIKEKVREDIGEEELRNIEIKCLDDTIPFMYTLYDYLVENYRLDLIKKYYTIDFGTDKNNQVVICDYFAGEGSWLKTFKNIIPSNILNPKDNNIHLIGNELEENRYNTMIQDGLVDEYTNLPFEKLQLPKHHASLILFNPPYGSTNGIRNAKHYLQMIIDRKYLYNHYNQHTKSHPRGVIICVLREDDILDCAEILVRNFDINYKQIYKVNDEEYNKYKQFVLIGKLRTEPLGDNRYEIYSIEEGIDKIRKAIDLKNEFTPKFYDNWYFNGLSCLPYKSIRENFKYVIKKDNYISKNDNVWKWVKESTELKDLSTEKIVIPKDLKLGELSLLISSGYINGELDLDGKAKHIAIGGVKNITNVNHVTKKNEIGESYTETTTTRKTKPYLNLLINNDGKMEIKQLGEEVEIGSDN